MADALTILTDLDLLGLTGVLRMPEVEVRALDRKDIAERLKPFKFPAAEVRRITDPSTDWNDEDMLGVLFHFGAKPWRFASRNQYNLAFDPRPEIAAVGGWRSAKTQGGIIRATRLSTWYPGNKGIIGRFASTDLAATTQADCLAFWEEANLLDDFKEKGRLKVPTAILKCVIPETQEIIPGQYSLVMFLHMDNPAHIHGHEVGWGWIDEAHECPQASRDKLKGRISLKGYEHVWSLWETSNPNGHDRLYDYYFNEEKLGQLKAKNPRAYKSRRGIVTTTPENRFLSKEYIQGLQDSLSEKNQRVFLYGSFEAFEGQIHEEWDERLHIIPFSKYFPNGIPAHWERLLAGDPGGCDDWAFEFAALDPDHNVILYDEFCQPGTRIAPFADALNKRGAGKDSSLKWKFKVIDYENKLAAGELAEHGILFNNAIKKNKTDSIFRFDGYLHPNPAHAFPQWHLDRKGKPGSPRFFVADTCKHAIGQIPQMRWRKKRGSEVMESELDPNAGPDHSYHCLIYKVRMLPRAVDLPKAKVVNMEQWSAMTRIMRQLEADAKEKSKRERWSHVMGHGGRFTGKGRLLRTG